MPRKNLIRSRIFPYHVVNQCNNREWFQLPPPKTWEIMNHACLEATILCGAKIHSFVLMANHFHMMISTPEMDLGETMAFFAGTSTRLFNEASGRCGHLYRGPYKWSLVGRPLYYSYATKYIYRNPVRAGICSRPENHEFSTLSGMVGYSPLGFPLHRPLVPELEFFLPMHDAPNDWIDWLNIPFANEEEESIRKALRRKEFEISRNSSTGYRNPLKAS
jgi:REP element-mobilizing transposase RayT